MDIIRMFSIGLFCVSVFTLTFSLAYVGLTKNQIFEAFEDFKKGDKIQFREIGLGIFNPFAILFSFLIIPKLKTNKEFYEIKSVKNKYMDFKSTLKVARYGLIGLLISISGILISLYLEGNL